MGEKQYLTAPDPKQTKFPRGVPFIIGNEVAERFSFYGMNAILAVFLTQYLLDASGKSAYMNDEHATEVVHLFKASAYFFPIIGAMIADIFWGKYKTILLISLMYCLGHGSLALMDLGPKTGMWDMKPFLYAGLILIAIGAGGIKPCVSAHVGDQFGKSNEHRLAQIFNWFYFSINTGAATSMIATPWLLEHTGPTLAFGIPGILMGLATLVFWLGRNTFVHVPASGWKKFKKETFSPDGVRALKNLAPLFLLFVASFWAIFDQTASTWVLQAEEMDRWVGDVEVLSSQLQSVNAFLIMALIPVFAFIIYPLLNKVIPLTPLRKIGIGLTLGLLAAVISALIQVAIESKAPAAAAELSKALSEAGITAHGSLSELTIAARDAGWTNIQIRPYLADMPHMIWQILAYVVLTCSEIMVSIVCLEFAYTQSPLKMKSFIMGVYFLGVSLGNIFVAALNMGLDQFRNENGETMLEGASYNWFFAGIMGVSTIAFVLWAKSYKGKTFIQGDELLENETLAEGTEPR